MKRAFGLIFLLAFFFSLWTAAMDEAAAAGLPEKLLRLRVVAESDSPQDQADKLLARDAVLAALEPALAGSSGLAEARAVTAEALPRLAEAAGRALETAPGSMNSWRSATGERKESGQSSLPFWGSAF